MCWHGGAAAAMVAVAVVGSKAINLKHSAVVVDPSGLNYNNKFPFKHGGARRARATIFILPDTARPS